MTRKKSKKSDTAPCIDVEKLVSNKEETSQDPLHSEEYGPQSFYKLIDRFFQANLAKLTHGVNPAGVRVSFVAWVLHLMQSPGRMLELYWYFPLHFQTLLQ